jgi:hypothetical protein
MNKFASLIQALELIRAVTVLTSSSDWSGWHCSFQFRGPGERSVVSTEVQSKGTSLEDQAERHLEHLVALPILKMSWKVSSGASCR